MKSLPLTQGQFALVDDSDYEKLSKYRWCAQKDGENFYAVRQSPRVNGKQRSIKMARQILGLELGDKRQADHINHRTLDNRQSNLRICTHRENMMNMKSHQNTISHFKGVCWNKHARKWVTRILIEGKRILLGYYDDEEEAARAYDKTTKQYFGEFAYLNFRGVE